MFRDAPESNRDPRAAVQNLYVRTQELIERGIERSGAYSQSNQVHVQTRLSCV